MQSRCPHLVSYARVRFCGCAASTGGGGGGRRKKRRRNAQCEDCGVRADAEALLMKYMVQHTPHEEKAEEED